MPSRRIVCRGVLGLVVLAFGGCGETPKSPPSRLTVTVYGGAQAVAGSLTVLDLGSTKWMVDCGSTYGEVDAEASAAGGGRSEPGGEQLPPGAAGVDGLAITHAHLDHIGRVPALARAGFRGPIYLTTGTAALARIMLHMQVRYDELWVRNFSWSAFGAEQLGRPQPPRPRDRQPRASVASKPCGPDVGEMEASQPPPTEGEEGVAIAASTGGYLTVHWRACDGQAKIKRAGTETTSLSSLRRRFGEERVSPCKCCADMDVAEIASFFTPLEYGVPRLIAPGVNLTLLDAGHIPGSSSIRFDVELPQGRRSVLFSGDLGNELSTLIEGPRPAPVVDAVFVETTYGSKVRSGVPAEEFEDFQQALSDTLAKGGIAWIPAFALDRTQKILHQVVLAQRAGRVPPGVPIYAPSPTGRAISNQYRRPENADWFRYSIRTDAVALKPEGVVSSRDMPSTLRGPAILVTTSGMMDEAFSKRLLKPLLEEDRTCVFIVGWQDPRTPGGRLSRGDRDLQDPMTGSAIQVRADVRQYGVFSAHGDAADIDRWLGNVPASTPVFLVHGEPESLSARRDQLLARGRSSVAAPRPGEPIDLIR